MKRASFTLIKIAIIVSFVIAGSLLIYGVYLIITRDAAIQEAVASSSDGYKEWARDLTASLNTIFTKISFYYAMVSMINGFVCIIAKVKPCKITYILCIVFGFLSMIIVNAIGGILGIKSMKQEQLNQIEE